MTHCLPPNLLALFAPRDPIPFLPPPVKLPHEKKREHQGGLSEFVNLFETAEETPPKPPVETKEERKARKTAERKEVNDQRIQEYLDSGLYDPNDLQDATMDSFKTLLVARMNYDTSESKLRREFEYFGPIRKIKIIYDLNGKPRGYAFIEYEHERDMRSAYKHADGKKIDGRRVLVDVERARTVEGWLPRRLGGGLGNTRKTLLPKWKRELGLDEPSERRRASSREKHRERKKRSRSRDKERKRSRSKDRKKERKRTRSPRPADGEEKPVRRRSKSRERKRRRSRDKPDGRDSGRNSVDPGTGSYTNGASIKSEEAY